MIPLKFVSDPIRVFLEPASLSALLCKKWTNCKATSPLDSEEDGKFPWKPKLNRSQTLGFFWANILRETKVMMMWKAVWGCPLAQTQVDENRDSHRWIIASPLLRAFASGNAINTSSKNADNCSRNCFWNWGKEKLECGNPGFLPLPLVRNVLLFRSVGSSKAWMSWTYNSITSSLT